MSRALNFIGEMLATTAIFLFELTDTGWRSAVREARLYWRGK